MRHMAILWPITLVISASSIAQAQDWKHFPSPPKAPSDAPNIIIILTDDVGYGASSTFGGPISTPTFDYLASIGLRYTQFNTTGMCSPTRAALLTGRNHHSVATGTIVDVATDHPGYTSVIPSSAATIGRILRDVGYSTAWFGKNHNTPTWESGPFGPFERWPNAWGFDYAFGFNGSGTDQFTPSLIENRNNIRPPADPEYFLDRDLVDRLVNWIGLQNTLQPGKPFFVYLAPATMHSPQQAPAEAIARYRGQFDQGWDVIRQQTFVRQKIAGLIPTDTVMTPRPAEIPAWESQPKDARQVYARMMEVAAGQLHYFDHQFGRVIDELKRLKKFDNTLIVYVQGDNGAAMEMEHGLTNLRLYASRHHETISEMLAKIDQIGGPGTSGNYPAGWGWATNAPFPWGKQVASHLGGLRAGVVISWPRRIQDQGGIRPQFGHVIDIAPTIYDAVGITPPHTVDGVRQQPIEGTSLLETFGSSTIKSRHRKQYFEMLGNRSYYEDGWMVSTIPVQPPWELDASGLRPLDYRWSLFDLRKDFAQANDLAADNPTKLAEMKSAFMREVRHHHVEPITADYLGRANPALRPPSLPEQEYYEFRPSDTRFPGGSFPRITDRWSASVKLVAKSDHDSGPILSMGNRFSGLTLVLEHGAPVLTYDPTARASERRVLRGSRLRPGPYKIDFFFRRSHHALTLNLAVNEKLVVSAPIEKADGVGGDTYVGRKPLDDRTGQERCDCEIEILTVFKAATQ